MAGKYKWNNIDINDMVYKTGSGSNSLHVLGLSQNASTSIEGYVNMPGSKITMNRSVGTFSTSDYTNETEMLSLCPNNSTAGFAVYLDSEGTDFPYKMTEDGTYKSIFHGDQHRLAASNYKFYPGAATNHGSTNSAGDDQSGWAYPDSETSGWQNFPSWCNAIKVFLNSPIGLPGKYGPLYNGMFNGGVAQSDLNWSYNSNRNVNNDHYNDKDNVNHNHNASINYSLSKDANNPYQATYDYCDDLDLVNHPQNAPTKNFQKGGSGGIGIRIYNIEYIEIQPSWVYKFDWIKDDGSGKRGYLQFTIKDNDITNNTEYLILKAYSGDKGDDGVAKTVSWSTRKDGNAAANLGNDDENNLQSIAGHFWGHGDDSGDSDRTWSGWNISPTADYYSDNASRGAHSVNSGGASVTKTTLTNGFKKVVYNSISNDYNVLGSVFFFKKD